MRIETTKNGSENLYFDSWLECVDYSANRPYKLQYTESSRMIGGHYGAGFTGVNTFAEALELAHKGWSEGTAHIKKLSANLVERVTREVSQDAIQFDVTGMDYDVGTYLMGAPEHWYSMEKQAGEGKVVRIIHNINASAGVDKAVITAKGAAIVALVECLELARVRVEVVVVSTTGEWSEESYRLSTFVTVKQASQPLDIDMMAFAIAHPASLRRIMFGVWEGSERFMRDYHYGYGSVSPVPKFYAKHGDGTIIIEKSYLYEPQWSNPEAATAWVMNSLKEQGVKMVE